MGAEMILQVLGEIDTIAHVPQDSIGVTHAAKIERGDSKLDFNRPVRLIHCQVRAFALKPGAYFIHNGEMIKILDAEYIVDPESANFTPGEVVDDKLTIACADGFLIPKLMQREGRKMIYTDAFLRGYNIAQGSVIYS
jgi:methionyl-tRNA formyltransferase